MKLIEIVFLSNETLVRIKYCHSLALIHHLQSKKHNQCLHMLMVTKSGGLIGGELSSLSCPIWLHELLGACTTTTSSSATTASFLWLGERPSYAVVSSARFVIAYQRPMIQVS